MKKIISLALALYTSSAVASDAPNLEVLGHSNCGYTKAIDEETGKLQISVYADDLSASFTMPATILPITASTKANISDPSVVHTEVSVRYDLGFLHINSRGQTDFMETKNLVMKIDTELDQPQIFWLTYGVAGVPFEVKYCRF